MLAVMAVMGPLTREEFADFYRQTAPALRNYLARVTGHADVAADLLQEAYIRLIHASPESEAQRRAYLYRTATNLALDHFRAARRERAGLAFWKRRQPAVTAPEGAAIGLENVFAGLHARERALLWLAYVEEATHAEIAATLGCGQRSVRVLLFRARRNMRRLLREHNIESGGER